MRELVLDTKGVCFLCLEKIFPPPHNSSVNVVTEICLRNICRFLKLDPCSVLLKSLNCLVTDDDDDINKEPHHRKCDFNVILCEKCYTVVNKLTLMIKELEVAKMLLDHQLGLFHKIMMDSQTQDKNNSILEIWKSTDYEQTSNTIMDEFTESQMTMEAKLVDTLRQETEEKCRQHFESCLKMPRVVLYRHDDTRSKKRKHSYPPLPSSEIMIESPCNNPVTELEINEVQSCSVPFQEPNCYELPPFSVHPLNEQDLEIDTSTTTMTNLAVQENLYATTNFGTSSEMECHSDRSPLDFIPQLDYNNWKIGDQYQCPFCEKSFNFSPTILKNTQAHLTYLHPGKIFATKRLAHIPETTFENICVEMLRSEEKCIQGVQSCQSDESSRGYKSPYVFKCSYCDLTCKSNLRCHYVKCHFKILAEKLINFQTNYQEINSIHYVAQQQENDLGGLQPTSSLLPKSTFEHFVKANKSNEHNTSSTARPERIHQNESNVHSCSSSTSKIVRAVTPSKDTNNGKNTSGRTRYACLYCPQSNLRSDKVNVHIMACHMEEMFIQSKLPHVDSGQFKRLCPQVLKSEVDTFCIKTKQQTDGKWVNQCCYCDKTYVSARSLRYHLCCQHKDILGEKLRNAQRNLKTNISAISVSHISSDDNSGHSPSVSNHNKREILLLEDLELEGLGEQEEINYSTIGHNAGGDTLSTTTEEQNQNIEQALQQDWTEYFDNEGVSTLTNNFENSANFINQVVTTVTRELDLDNNTNIDLKQEPMRLCSSHTPPGNNIWK